MNLAELRAEKIGLLAPFNIEVSDGLSIECLEIFRHLPGKRLVFLARSKGETALVKLFFQRKYFEREHQGLQGMRVAQVPCPKELWHVESGGSYLLATEFLSGAISLDACYRRFSNDQLLPILREVLSSIASLHRSGWMQADIHLDNFLLFEKQLHLIDGGGICALKSPINNLGLFFAQMTPKYDVLIPSVLDAYGKDAPSIDAILKAVRLQREWRIKHYLGKCLRNCTQFEASRPNGNFVVMSRQNASSLLKEVMAQPDKFIDSGEYLKKGNSSTVVVVVGDEADWVIKRYNIKSRWHGCKRSLQPSRASVSWQNAHRLELLGIATPKPLAMRENRIGLLRQQAYLVTENVTGESLFSFLHRTQGQPIPKWLGAEIFHMFSIFFEARVSHGDMKATNFLLAEERLQVLDLDAMRWHSNERAFVKAFRKDLQRFMANWQGETQWHFEQLLQPLAQQVGIIPKIPNRRIVE